MKIEYAEIFLPHKLILINYEKALCLVLFFPLLATKLNLDLKSTFPIRVHVLGRKKHSSANLVVAYLEAQVIQETVFGTCRPALVYF